MEERMEGEATETKKKKINPELLEAGKETGTP